MNVRELPVEPSHPETMAQALAKSEERFRQVVESYPSGVVMIDQEGLIVLVNSQAEKMFGYARIEMLGQPVEMLVPERFRGGHPAMREGFFYSPQTRSMGAGRDLYALRKDGGEFPVEIGLNPLDNEQGPMVLAAVIDISERKRMEERFRLVVESSPSAMVLIGKNGAIEMVNTQAERLFGYRRSEMLGQAVSMLVPERFRNNHPTLRDAFFRAPTPRPMDSGLDLYALRKDGSEFPVEIGLNPIETDGGTMVLSAIVDISLRKQLEERFRRVVESTPNGMIMVNQAGLIEMVNTQTERIFGYERTELIGQSIDMLIPERYRAGHPGHRSLFFGDPRARPMGAGRDLYARRKDGSEIPVEIGLSPLETPEGVKVLSSVVDISDRKQREESIQASLREKDILLGEIHHRVKNNLQIVHSLLDLQSTNVSDPRIVGMLRESQNRVRSMALIHQTLYESKDFARVDFRRFLDTLVPTLVSSYSVGPEQVKLSFSLDNVPLPINAAIPCGLVVNELVSNALKHAFPSGRSGEIAISMAYETPGTVLLSVSDTGVGIPEDFDIDLATTLGLQLVVLLVDQLGGELSIQRSNPTRFDLRFQVQQ